MLLNERFIYLELQKTGSTHTRNILKKIPGLNHEIYGKHSLIGELPENLVSGFKDKLKIGNIRNPWDWYISLWAFGCMGQGMLFRNLTKKDYFLSKRAFKRMLTNVLNGKSAFKNISFTNWNQFYTDPKNIRNFRCWLKLILDSKKVDLGENYKKLPISDKIGLLTFRYLRLYTENGQENLAVVSDLNSVFQLDKELNFMDVIFRIETLHEDILNAHQYLNCSKRNLNDILNNFDKKTNSSVRGDKLPYYDRETFDLVNRKESLIIQKYGYDYSLIGEKQENQ
jgi:hypothetical protein